MSLSVTSFDQLERTLAPNYPDCHLLGARFRRLLVTQQDQERLVHVGTSKLRSTADELSEKLLSVEGDKDKHTESKWGILRLGESRTRFQGNHFVYRIHFILGEDLHLTDTDGRELIVRVIAIMGKSALLEYRPYSKGDKRRA